MRIEIVYPEICCLYGDKANMMYLKRCLPQAEFITTHLTDDPAFLDSHVDLVYFGSMSETNQELVIDLLGGTAERFRELAQAEKTSILLTGNSWEILGRYIEREDGTEKRALNVFDFHSVRQTPDRFNSLILGSFESTTLLGYTSRFSHSYLNDPLDSLFTVDIGVGINPDTKSEGIHVGRLIGTYLLGPLLIANPDFTKYLLGLLGAPDTTLPFEEEIYQAYTTKLVEYLKPGIELE